MNRSFRLFFVLFLPIYFSLVSFLPKEDPPGTKDIEFFQGSLSQLQSLARSSQRPYLVFFYTDWCEPCNDLHEKTLRSERVSTYLNEHYYSFRINADIYERGEEALVDKFEVDFFPTVLLFNSSGSLVNQFSGHKDAQELLKELKTIYFENAAAQEQSAQAVEMEFEYQISNNGENRPYQNYGYESSSQQQYSSQQNRPYSSSKSIEQQGNNTPYGSRSKSLSGPGWDQGSQYSYSHSSLPRGDGLYQVQIKRHNTGGYAVQVGVFKQYQNALFQMEQSRSYFDREMLMDVNSLHNEPVFKVMFGPFDSATEARRFLKEYQRSTRQTAVLVDLSWFE